MSTLTESLELIGSDIVQVLKDNSNKPMTQDELFANRKLMNYSEYGWSFAIDRLEKKKVITIDHSDKKGNLYYKLK
jgi:hypothetical protein